MTCTDCTPQSTDVVLDFDNSQFTGSSNSRNLPAIGTGAFSIKENNIQFSACGELFVKHLGCYLNLN